MGSIGGKVVIDDQSSNPTEANSLCSTRCAKYDS